MSHFPKFYDAIDDIAEHLRTDFIGPVEENEVLEMEEPLSRYSLGILWAQPKSKEYLKIRNDSLKEVGFDVSEVAEMKVMDAKPDVMSLVLFIGGIVVALIGAVVIIASFVKSRRKYDDEFYY